MRFYPGILALLLTPPGLPSGGFHWQRTITPPPGAPLAQACVILDAQTFANAAPALRDLRLFQEGVELPYAVEESYDPRALENGVTPDDDRSIYEPALIATLQLSPSGSFLDGAISPPGTPRPLPKDQADPHPEFSDEVELSARVPVERIRLDPAPSGDTSVTAEITATELQSAHKPAPSETLRTTFDANHPSRPITLGANLQHQAAVSVDLRMDRGTGKFSRVIFEMRRRSLCYQPRSASPLTLYLGGGEAMTAKTYGYASNFSTALERPYASVGPLVPNPDIATTPAVVGLPSARKRMLLAAALAGGFFLIAARGMLRTTKSPAL